MIALPQINSYWAFWPNTRHLEYMLSYGEKIKMAWREGTLHDHDKWLLTDMEIEASLRIHAYEHWNWTGTQDPGLPPEFIDSALDLLQYQEAHQHENDGKGPTWSCGPYSVAYVGLLAAYGIPARRVWNSRPSDGAVDNAVEYWDRDWQKRVFVVPQICTHFTRDCLNLSVHQWAGYDRIGYNYTPVTLSGKGDGAFAKPIPNLNGYRGMSGNPHVAPGNYPHAGGQGQFKPNHWRNFQLMPKLAGAAEFPHDEHMPLPNAHGTYDLGYVLGEPRV